MDAAGAESRGFEPGDGRLGHRRRWLGLVVVLGILCVPALALATQTKTAVVKVDFGQALRADCPSGQEVVQGGVKGDVQGSQFAPPTSLKYYLTMRRMSTAFPSGTWATFFNFGPEQTSVVLEALCSRGDPKVKAVTSSTMISPGSGGSVTAHCSSGTTVRLGGFQTTFSASNPGSRLTVDGLTRPTPRNWTVSGFNYGGAAGELEAIAYCGVGPALTPTSSTVTLPASNAQTSATAHCPHGKRMLLGGFSAPFSGFGPVFDLLTPAVNAITAGVYDYAGEKQVNHLTAIAYCG